MRKVLFFFIFIIPFILNGSVFAHPGRTAADGCHYCRTNCDRWGVPWNERHCHGGGAAVQGVQESAPIYVLPTNTPIPLPTWTPVPTSTLTPTITPIPTNTQTPQPTKIIEQKINKVKAVNKQTIKKKTFWQWLFSK